MKTINKKANLVIIIISTIIVTFFVTNIANAQTEFAPIGAEWYFSEPSGETSTEEERDYQKYVSEKDTIVAGKTCRLITNRFYPPEILYEENGIVYYYYLNDFRKIFDFTANEGDIVDFEFKTHCLPDSNYQLEDSVVMLPCLIHTITTHIDNGVTIKTFNVIILQNEILGYTTYSYTEVFGQTHIRCDYFIPYFLRKGWIDNASVGYRSLRCYHDNNINYVSNWCVQTNNPCDFSPPSSINEKENTLIEVFPNPANNYLFVQVPENFTNKQIIIEIYNITGRLVHRKEYNSDSTIKIDISNLTTGSYFFKIKNKTNANTNTELNYKFIKL